MQILLPVLEERKQERRHVLIHFHFQFRPKRNHVYRLQSATRYAQQPNNGTKPRHDPRHMSCHERWIGDLGNASEPKDASSLQIQMGKHPSCSKPIVPYPPYELNVEPFASNQVGNSVSTTMMEPSQIGKMPPRRLETISCFEGCERKRRLRLSVVKLRLNSDCCHLPDWFLVPIEAKQGLAHAKAMYVRVWAMNEAIHLGPR